MVHPFRRADTGETSSARLLAAFMVMLALTVAAALVGFLLAQNQANHNFRQRVDVEVHRQIRTDICDLIISVQPRSKSELAVGAYGKRIQHGSRASGERTGCTLPTPP